MSQLDEWLKPSAIIPVTNETIRILVEHIKKFYEKETTIIFKTHIEWDIGWDDVKTTSTRPANLQLMFDRKTGQLKSAEMI